MRPYVPMPAAAPAITSISLGPETRSASMNLSTEVIIQATPIHAFRFWLTGATIQFQRVTKVWGVTETGSTERLDLDQAFSFGAADSNSYTLPADVLTAVTPAVNNLKPNHFSVIPSRTATGHLQLQITLLDPDARIQVTGEPLREIPELAPRIVTATIAPPVAPAAVIPPRAPRSSAASSSSSDSDPSLYLPHFVTPAWSNGWPEGVDHIYLLLRFNSHNSGFSLYFFEQLTQALDVMIYYELRNDEELSVRVVNRSQYPRISVIEAALKRRLSSGLQILSDYKKLPEIPMKDWA